MAEASSQDGSTVQNSEPDTARRELVERAWAFVDDRELQDLTAALIDIPSPTGDERAIAEFAAEWLSDHGVTSRYQPIDDRQGNAVGSVGDDGDGPDLLLYAPIDTVTVGSADEDVPGVGPSLRPDMRCRAEVAAGIVRGLGASNPKGHAACVMVAARAVAAAGAALRGRLHVGLGAGGMPTNRRPGAARHNTGQGNGCSFMLEQGLHTDYAVIAKPGWAVAWEEVGLCWFRVTVRGTYNYVGSRHRLPYRNAIVDAGTVIADLDGWFAEYSARHTAGLVAPQGQVGWIGGGWERMPAFSPASCSFLVDLRIAPGTSPAAARREFVTALQRIARERGVELDCEMILSVPGTSTPRESWIVRSATRAWELVEGRPHDIPAALRTTSGATDANILRGRGIPTARIGMSRITDGTGAEADFPLGMNAASVAGLRALTRLLVATAVDTCSRSRANLDDPDLERSTR